MKNFKLNHIKIKYLCSPKGQTNSETISHKMKENVSNIMQVIVTKKNS